MRTIEQTRHSFHGTHKGATIDIKRESLGDLIGRFYIIVTAKDGGHLYDGWAPESVITIRQAKAEATRGACLDKPKPTGFILKCFRVSVTGFGDYPYFTSSRGKALAKAWADFGRVSDMPYKEFLSIAKCRTLGPPEQFGKAITVCGAAAYFVSSDPQYVQFVRPDSDVILNSHPYDVEPEEMRPSTYRKEPAQ